MGSSTASNTGLHTHAADIEDRGLHFTNDEWNGSIANGQPIMLRWNESINAGEMKLFKVSYHVDGLMALEPIGNWTEPVDGNEYLWTPEGLDEDNLYTLRVTKKGTLGSRWAMSPPWKLDEEKEPSTFHWSSPVGIPIVVILGLYFVCLFTCLMYRRRKRLRLEAQQAACIEVSEAEAERIAQDAAASYHRHHDRPGSSSVVTVESLAEDEMELAEKVDPIFILDDGLRFSDNDGDQPLRSNSLDESREELHERTRAAAQRCHSNTVSRVVWVGNLEEDERIGQAR